MLKSEGILSFLKKTLLMWKKSHPLSIFSHSIKGRFRNMSSFGFSKHNLMIGQLYFFLFTFLTFCCLESSNNSSLLQVHNRKLWSASFRSLVSPWTPHAGRRNFPFSLNKADSHPAQQLRNNWNAYRPIWQWAPFMLPRTLTLAQLSWTYALLRLTSSMKSFLLSSARFSSRWASSTAFLVCIPINCTR